MEVIEWMLNIFKEVYGEYYIWVFGVMLFLLIAMVYNKSMSLAFAGFVAFIMLITINFLIPSVIIKYVTILIALLLAVLVYRSLKNPYG